MGLLKVGPQSAGSEPGPVCYGRGGSRPTVTDADLVLGYLSPTYFLGGEMELDMAAVRRALEEYVAEPLGVDVVEAAIGIRRIVDENMAAATRMYIAEKGRDPRQYAMLAFGGAGPVHAHSLARLLGLRRLVVPLGAGVTSALGFLVAAPAIDLARSHSARLEDFDWQGVDELLKAMEQEAREFLAVAGISSESLMLGRSVDMRYLGQGFEIPIEIPYGCLDTSTREELAQRFEAAYERHFGRSIRGVPVEALTWRLAARGPAPEVALSFSTPQAEGGPLKGSRNVYFPELGFVRTNVFDRYRLRPGSRLIGPAVVEERESTTVIGPGSTVEVDSHLNLIIDIKEAPSQCGADSREKSTTMANSAEISRV